MTKNRKSLSYEKNLELWEFSLGHPEQILDYHYFVDIEKIVIPENSNFHSNPQKLDMNSLASLEKKIVDVFRYLAKDNDLRIRGKDFISQMQYLQKLMDSPSANLTTFRSFWPVLDMSYSVYKSLTSEQQIAFLQVAAIEFLEKRHKLYENHGYSLSTQQVLADTNAHKAQGTTAAKKLAKIFEEHGLSRAKNVDEFLSNQMTYALMEDSIKITDLSSMRKYLGIKFQWHDRNQKKKPDFFIHLRGDEFYFGEAKHKKEGGGGQNDQIKEIIKFIGFGEARANFGYISFLDGIYFNSLISNTESIQKRFNKGQTQSKEIHDALKEFPNNYFLNTEGMKKFLTLKLE